MPLGTVHVRGLKELTRDFKKISKELDRELVGELKEASEPVRKGAESLSLTRIRNMPRSPDWATMRIGVSRAKGLVYVVPAHRRGRGSSRPNLSGLLLTQMESAVEQNEDEVVRRIDGMIDRLGRHNGF